ncbi:DUF4153 domain-containing protein [Verrucomicrobiota bacterium sgz303538]
MNSVESLPPPLPIAQLGRVLLPALALTCGADFLFWNTTIGANLGIFACVAAGLHLASQGKRQWNRSTWIAVGFLAATAVQSAVEISLSNVIVLVALLVWLLGESWFQHLPSSWGRWIEAQFALVRAPERWNWLWRTVEKSALLQTAGEQASPDKLVRGLKIIAPAVILGFVFILVLSSGNAVLRELLRTLSGKLAQWITSFDFSIGRVLFWAVVSSLSLAWFQPARESVVSWAWARSWPAWKRSDEGIATWQSLSVLFVLNALFFAANTLDVIYLWFHARLPEGVTPSQYVHSGVASLTLAVLLSAVVLAGIFQQNSSVTRAKGMRELAYLWIAQNVLLIAGVFLRLKMYIDTYHWSELRVYVGCFLLLVATGFALLAWKIAREKTLGWLVLANLGATLGLFFVLQFADVAGWVARANINQWQREPERGIDINYLAGLGPSAWPSLLQIAENDRVPYELREVARKALLAQSEVQKTRLARLDWRSFQARRDRFARWLIQQSVAEKQ